MIERLLGEEGDDLYILDRLTEVDDEVIFLIVRIHGHYYFLHVISQKNMGEME